MGFFQPVRPIRRMSSNMPPEAFYYVAEGLFAVALLVWFFARPWQAFCLDASRHRYFELRDRLFVLAVEKRISFSDPSYKVLREWLNSRIRMAHRHVFGDFIALIIACRGEIPKINTVGNELEKIEDETLRRELQAIYYQAIHVQIQHMVVRSPIILILAVLAPLIFLIELIDGSVRVTLRWVTNLAQVADDDAAYR